ncbi:MAG: SDR family oxidoreductase [Candidatus Competibacteraceae bacterium]
MNKQAEIVVVTGASAGVGRATAQEFGRQGAKVALLARGRDGLEGARREIEAAGGQAMVIPTDVADPDQVEAAAAQVEREWGPIDIWVNDAMVTIFAPIKALGPAEFKRSTEVTYLGTVYGTMAALKRMLPRNRGTIVQVGSALSYRAIPLQAPYCGAKFAIRGFTDSLRSELLHDRSRVHVTMVQLSAFNTPQFDWSRSYLPNKLQPVPPIFQPEVAARAIVWAAHHRRREVWVGWPAVKAILGNKLLPWLGDRVLAHEGYRGQQTDQPADLDRRDNLFEPLPGDFGAHGRFDARARSFSWQLWASLNRGWLLAAVGGAFAAGTVLGYGARVQQRISTLPYRWGKRLAQSLIPL